MYSFSLVSRLGSYLKCLLLPTEALDHLFNSLPRQLFCTIGRFEEQDELHQHDSKKRMNLSSSSKSSYSQRGKELNKFCPPNISNIFCLFFLSFSFFQALDAWVQWGSEIQVSCMGSTAIHLLWMLLLCVELVMVPHIKHWNIIDILLLKEKTQECWIKVPLNRGKIKIFLSQNLPFTQGTNSGKYSSYRFFQKKVSRTLE